MKTKELEEGQIIYGRRSRLNWETLFTLFSSMSLHTTLRGKHLSRSPQISSIKPVNGLNIIYTSDEHLSVCERQDISLPLFLPFSENTNAQASSPTRSSISQTQSKKEVMPNKTKGKVDRPPKKIKLAKQTKQDIQSGTRST